MPTNRRRKHKRRQPGLSLDQALSLQVGWTLFDPAPFGSDAERRRAWAENRERCMAFEPGPHFDPFGKPRTPGTKPKAWRDYEDMGSDPDLLGPDPDGGQH